LIKILYWRNFDGEKQSFFAKYQHFLQPEENFSMKNIFIAENTVNINQQNKSEKVSDDFVVPVAFIY